jgi:hypothetical protein
MEFSRFRRLWEPVVKIVDILRALFARLFDRNVRATRSHREAARLAGCMAKQPGFTSDFGMWDGVSWLAISMKGKNTCSGTVTASKQDPLDVLYEVIYEMRSRASGSTTFGPVRPPAWLVDNVAPGQVGDVSAYCIKEDELKAKIGGSYQFVSVDGKDFWDKPFAYIFVPVGP